MINKTPLILVTGATGAIGPTVVETLYEAGYSVRTLSIDSPQTGMLPSGVGWRIGDITDPSAVGAAMRGVGAVIHLAALLHIANPRSELNEQYQRINIEGTRTVVKAAIQAGVQRIVFFSTIAVYGDAAGQVLTEDAPAHPDTFYAETKLAAERVVLDAKNQDGLPIATVLRLGAVYGPRIKGNYRRLLYSLSRGTFVPVGHGRNRRSLVYDRDAARAALTVLRHSEAAGRVYNVTDGKFHTMNEIVARICEALGRKPPRISLPLGPVRFAAGMFEDAGRFVGFRPPIGRATIEKYTEDVAVDGTRIQRELGFKPEYDLRSGWRETVHEMRKMGEL